MSFLKSLAAVVVLMALAAAPVAAQLTLLGDHRVYVQYAGPGQPNTVEFDPSTKEATVGNSYAMADFGGGTYKASAFWPATVSGAVKQIAYSGADFGFRNDDPGSITGTFSLDIKAVLSQIFGPSNGGVFENFVIGVISGSAPGYNASAGVAYQYTGRGGPTDFFSVASQSNSPGSSTVITTGTTSALDAMLTLASFSLAPGAIIRFSVSLQTGASGSQLGWGAFTDAAHSAQQSLVLPAGVTVTSPIPLPWVTSVPEPSTAVLTLAGLAGLAAQRRPKA